MGSRGRTWKTTETASSGKAGHGSGPAPSRKDPETHKNKWIQVNVTANYSPLLALSHLIYLTAIAGPDLFEKHHEPV